MQPDTRRTAVMLLVFCHVLVLSPIVVSMTMPRPDDDPPNNVPYRTPYSVNHNYYGPVHGCHYGMPSRPTGTRRHHDAGSRAPDRLTERNRDDRSSGENKGDNRKHGRRGERRSTGNAIETSRLWRFQVGDNFGPYEYIDIDGYVKGFHIDLIQAVCKQAKKSCRHILDIYTNCWKTTGGLETPGIALLAGWYDACVGLLPSPDRLNSFNFSVPFTPNARVALHYRSARIDGDPKNLTGRTIGFIDGWAVGQKCLSRQLAFTGSYEKVMFDRYEDMVAALVKGNINALLTTDALNKGKLRLQAVVPWFSCTTQGTSVMAHYGSDVIDWWNKAFRELRENGKYRKLCEEAAVAHEYRGKVNCLSD